MRVVDGRVLKKNNWRLDPSDYRAVPQREIRLDRRRPPDGARHLITIAQLRTFITLLPDWEEVAIGLEAILLDSATDCDGWCGPGVVAVCAWHHDLWDWWDAGAVEEHRHLLDLLDVERVPIERSDEFAELADSVEGFTGRRLMPAGWSELRWTEGQARAYQLLHILPHELGHHHDRITSRAGRSLGRGEAYAEAYANRVLGAVWPAYARRFDL
jgi:hypothetical protein